MKSILCINVKCRDFIERVLYKIWNGLWWFYKYLVYVWLKIEFCDREFNKLVVCSYEKKWKRIYFIRLFL